MHRNISRFVVIKQRKQKRRNTVIEDPSDLVKKWRTIIVQYLLAPIIVAVLSFFTGTQIEVRKREIEKNKFIYEQKIRIWTTCAKYFSSYLTNYDRLRDITIYEKETGKFTAEHRSRKNQYLRDRDLAWEYLESSLWEATLIYSPNVKKSIDDFYEFKSTQKNLRISALAPMTVWCKHRDNIMTMLKEETLPK